MFLYGSTILHILPSSLHILFFFFFNFMLFLKSSDWLQYAERLPIGLEKVIRTVSHETVKQFYRKWYHLSNMAVVAVGDFSDTRVWFCWYVNFHIGTITVCFLVKVSWQTLSLSQSVVELIKTHFGQKSSAPEPPLIPTFPVPPHEDPRFSCFIESEAAGVSTEQIGLVHTNISAHLKSMIVKGFHIEIVNLNNFILYSFKTVCSDD